MPVTGGAPIRTAAAVFARRGQLKTLAAVLASRRSLPALLLHSSAYPLKGKLQQYGTVAACATSTGTRYPCSSSSSSSPPITRRMMSSQTQPKSEPTLEAIRDQLRAFDVSSGSSGGRLDLTLDERTGIATLCINSPARKNAWSGAMMAQFSDVLQQLEQWKEVCGSWFLY